MVGHSIGAVVAAAYRRAHAPSAAALLIGAPACDSATDAKSHLRDLGWLAEATVDATRTARFLCGAMCTLRPLASLGAQLLRQNVPRAVASDSVRHTWPSYSGTVEHVLLEHRIEPDIAAAATPTVLLHGSDDDVAPIDRAEQLAARLPSVQLQRIAGGGHHLPLSHPHQVATAVGELLARSAGR